MKILSVNCGSSSLKFQLFELPEEKVLISGVFERIGIDNSFYTIKINDEKIKKEMELKNHKQAFEILTEELINYKSVKDLNEIKGVGHRIVQGGSYFDKSVIIDNDVVEKISELSSLAPLHNPAAIIGIKASQEVMPNAIQVAVFDTAFHQTMKEETYLYALPYELYTKYKIRRYGAHGTSHKYLALKMAEILNTKNSKIITCHIGSGGSISAIKDSKCVNTSMGLTPNAGIIMGTRCGDIDATIITYLMQKENFTAEEINKILNKESGLLGISGISSDSRDIEDGIEEGNQRCILTNKMYVRRIIDYIAKYYVELEGVDAIVFSAGVGENSVKIRKDIMDGLKILGVECDDEKNNVRGKLTKITKDTSKIPCYIIPTNEELMIALDTYDLVK